MASGVICGNRTVDLPGLEDRARRGARVLKDRGARDRRVALLLRNDIAFVEATEAARYAGAAAVPINWHFAAQEVAYILADSSAVLLIAHADLWRRLEPHLSAGAFDPANVLIVPTPADIMQAYGIDPDDGAVREGMADWCALVAGADPLDGEPATGIYPLIYTAGTTGHPKGVLRRGSGKPGAVGYDAFFEPGIRTLLAAPLYHSAPNRICFGTLAAGGFVVLQPRFDAQETLALIQRYGITTTFMVPTMFHRMLSLPEAVREAFDPRSLRHVIVAGAPCPEKTKRRMIDWWGPVIYEYYGATEVSALTLCSSEEALARPGTVGRAVATARIAVFDADGLRCPPDVAGDIYGWRSDIPDFTYLGQPQARAEAGREGLVTVGDIGWLDKDGYLFISDRKTDMIISGGTNIYPAQVEAALLDHPDIVDCAVFGIPDKEMGEAVAAAIEPRGGACLSEQDLKQFLATRISPIMRPRTVEWCETLPRDANGKVQKRRLRDRFWKQTGRRV